MDSLHSLYRNGQNKTPKCDQEKIPKCQEYRFFNITVSKKACYLHLQNSPDFRSLGGFTKNLIKFMLRKYVSIKTEDRSRKFIDIYGLLTEFKVLIKLKKLR